MSLFFNLHVASALLWMCTSFFLLPYICYPVSHFPCHYLYLLFSIPQALAIAVKFFCTKIKCNFLGPVISIFNISLCIENYYFNSIVHISCILNLHIYWISVFISWCTEDVSFLRIFYCTSKKTFPCVKNYLREKFISFIEKWMHIELHFI